ncbi:GroES-like protein [Microthyrium microscopicum]|uniref:GroES-like protein n=1 Tax=Microthyrium microscopicum TaxID=703497 RepID=A0A6A6UPV6_9PEZI|nr:GroES-like protein [Microthyrium microscopicum]
MAPGAFIDLFQPIAVQHSAKSSSVQASVLVGPRNLQLEYRHLPEPASGELQIAIKYTGVCGSDVSYYKKFCNGDLKAVGPLTLGHESSGVVEAIGEGVTGFHVGDRVALEVGVPCDSCRACQKGRYNLCPKMRFRSSAKSIPHFQGTLQQKLNHPAKWCHKIPAHVSLEAAAMLEPLAVAIHATRRASIEPGDTAIVFGAGTVGLLTAAMAQISGASNVLIADLDAGRVAYALNNRFATKGFVVEAPNYTGSTEDKIRFAQELADDVVTEAFKGREAFDDLQGADVVFDCTGKEMCVQAGLFAARPGGQLVMVGMGTPIQTLQMSAAHLKEVDIIGIFRYCGTYATGIRLLSSGVLPGLEDMITHRFKGLASTQEAMELASRTVDDKGNLVLKVLIEA